MVGTASCHRVGHGLGTERLQTASPGHRPPFDPMVTTAPTFGRLDQWSRFRPNGQARGTAPNGHFDAALKTAGHGQGTKWAQDGHRMGTKQKATVFGGFCFAANSLI